MQKILYNVTIRIGHEKHQEWLEYIKDDHVPAVMATGRFESYRIQRMTGDEGDDGVTYAIGYVASDMAELQLYQTLEAPAIQADHHEKYSGYYGAFRSIMEIVDEG